MNIKEVMLNNPEVDLEDLVQMSFGVVDLSDGTLCLEDNIWRDLRDVEANAVDEAIAKENKIEDSWFNAEDEIPTINDEYGYHGEMNVVTPSADIYMSGLNSLGEGFKL